MTGLQWAVLTAYAKSLPAASEGRGMVEDLTAKEKPTATGQRVAWILAESAGMVKNGQITAHGKQAAIAFMPRLAVVFAKSQALTPPLSERKGGNRGPA